MWTLLFKHGEEYLTGCGLKRDCRYSVNQTLGFIRNGSLLLLLFFLQMRLSPLLCYAERKELSGGPYCGQWDLFSGWALLSGRSAAAIC